MSTYQPLSNYQTNRQKKPSGYGPGPEIYASHGPEYTTNNGPSIEEIYAGSPDHGYPGGEIEHNHIHALPAIHHKHKLSDVYESPVDHLPPPYIPSDYIPSLSGPSLGGSFGGSLHGLGNPMDLIYSSPYKLGGGGGPPKPSGGYGGLRPLLGSASSQSPTSTSSTSNYGQFLSSLLSAYSLGSLKPSSSKPSSQKGGLASYLNLPGLDLLKVSLACALHQIKKCKL